MWLSMALPFLSSLLGLGGGSRRGAGGRAGGMQAGGGLGLLGGLSPVSLAASFCLQTVGSWVALIADRTSPSPLLPSKHSQTDSAYSLVWA